MTKHAALIIAIIFLLDGEVKAIDRKFQQAACAILVTAGLTATDGSQWWRYENSFRGCGIIASPCGLLLTCRHLASPADIIDRTLCDIDNLEHVRAIEKVYLQYRVGCANGMMFSATFRPRIDLRRDAVIGRPFILLEAVATPEGIAGADHNLALIGCDATDVMIMKLVSTTPLPYLTLASLTEAGLAENDTEASGQYALTADMTDKTVTVTIREGFAETSEVLPRHGIPTITLSMKSYVGDSGAGVVNGRGELTGLLWGQHSPSNKIAKTFIIPASHLRSQLAPNDSGLQMHSLPAYIESRLARIVPPP